MVQAAFHICGFHIQGFNQLQIEKYLKKIPETSKKQNLNFSFTGNYLHSIYIVFTTTYIEFTLY